MTKTKFSDYGDPSPGPQQEERPRSDAALPPHLCSCAEPDNPDSLLVFGSVTVFHRAGDLYWVREVRWASPAQRRERYLRGEKRCRVDYAAILAKFEV